MKHYRKFQQKLNLYCVNRHKTRNMNQTIEKLNKMLQYPLKKNEKKSLKQN